MMMMMMMIILLYSRETRPECGTTLNMTIFFPVARGLHYLVFHSSIYQPIDGIIDLLTDQTPESFQSFHLGLARPY